ncbi:MAG: hypothetical protein PHU25_03970 [Deltaproteobacteria bacterium]|nr:hypothetical protein [Deltaproteobacteria bacterium]
MKRALALAAIAAALLAAVAGLGTESRGVSRALLPPSRPSVVDVHGRHKPGEPACVACHKDALSSRWASDRLAPTMEDCAACHPEAKGVTPLTPVTEACRSCHGPVPEGRRIVPGTYARPNVRFPHKAHAKEPCATCHPAAAAGRAAPPGEDTAGMRTCYACHLERKAPVACRTCHLVEADGVMVTRIEGAALTPPAWLKGPTHGATWVQSHASVAGSDSGFCAACHRNKFCGDCHLGRVRPRDAHPGDWIRSHAVSSRLDSPTCRGCHRSQSFCLDCHRRQGVAPDSPKDSRSFQGRYHGDLSPELICRRARTDIVSCASCHSESSCVSCHAAVNPHPSGWERRCAHLAKSNPRACAKCHSDDAWRRCR